MAAITKRGKTYSVRISYTDPFGKRRQKNKGGFRTKREAEYWAAKNEVRKLDGDMLVQADDIFSEYFEDWYHKNKEAGLKPATQSWYTNTIRVIKEEFPNVKMKDITFGMYQEFITKYGYSHVRKTVSKINGHIRMAVKKAIRDGVIRQDFTDDVNITGLASKEEELKYLNADEMQALIAACKSDLHIEHIVKFEIITALYTGCRFAEIEGITWADINWDFKTIHINKTFDYKTTKDFGDTKNFPSIRVIKVNDELLDVLKVLKAQQEEAHHRLGIKNPLNLVFMNNRGEVPSNDAANKTLRAVLATLDVARPESLNITFHALRHTHASYLLYQGVSIYYISQRLGHKSFAVTLAVYAHIIKELETRESDKAIRALEFKKEEEPIPPLRLAVPLAK